jgi:hypothetical protein
MTRRGPTEPLSGRKKKNKKSKSEEGVAAQKESMSNPTASNNGNSQQPKTKKADSSVKMSPLERSPKEKVKPFSKSSVDVAVMERACLRSPGVTPASTPPLAVKRQEAVVKGVPKEGVTGPSVAASVAMDATAADLRRSQPLGQLPYDKPPRLQQQQQLQTMAMQDKYSGASFNNSPSSATLLGDNYHPMLSSLQPTTTATAMRPELPRAIILPELKQQRLDRSPQQQPQNLVHGNQFGAIGCKVPVSPPPNGSSWADSLNGSSPLLSLSRQQSLVASSPASNLLTSASGLTIMQQLQAERRQREEEFRRTTSQWPGFGLDPESTNVSPSSHLGPALGGNYFESLWDPPAGPPPGGASPSAVRRPPEGLWGTIGRNVWPSTLLQSTDNGYGNSDRHHHHTSQHLLQYQHIQQQQQLARGGGSVVSGVGDDGNLLRFDPLALSSIWGANSIVPPTAGELGTSSSGSKQEQQKPLEPEHGSTWSSTLFTSKDL